MVEIPGTPPCDLTTNQSEESHAPCSRHPNVAFKNYSLKTTGRFWSFEQALSIHLAWPCNKTFSAPHSNVLVCLASLCVRYATFGFSNKGTSHTRLYAHTGSPTTHKQGWEVILSHIIPGLRPSNSSRKPMMMNIRVATTFKVATHHS